MITFVYSNMETENKINRNKHLFYFIATNKLHIRWLKNFCENNKRENLVTIIHHIQFSLHAVKKRNLTPLTPIYTICTQKETQTIQNLLVSN